VVEKHLSVAKQVTNRIEILKFMSLANIMLSHISIFIENKTKKCIAILISNGRNKKRL